MTDAGTLIGLMAFAMCLTSQISFAFYRYRRGQVICPVDVVVNRLNKHGCLLCAKTKDECDCPIEDRLKNE